MTTVRSPRSSLISALGRIEVAIWHAIDSAYMHIALLMALLVVALLGGLVPQIAPNIEPGSRHYQEWRGQLHAPWNAIAGALELLGLFRIFELRLFHLLMAVVAIVSVLRLLSLWVPRWAPTPPRGASVQHIALPYDESSTTEMVSLALRSVGLAIVRQLNYAGAKYAAAQRTGLVRFVSGLIYLGLLLVFSALAIESRLGWTGPRLDLALGETRLLDSEHGLAVRLEQIDLLPLPDGTWRRFDSHLSLMRGVNVEEGLVLGINRRATYQGLSLYQIGFEPAVRVTAQKLSGNSLRIQPTVGDQPAQRVLRLRFSGRQQEQSLTIPEADLIARLVYYPAFRTGSSSAPTLHVQLLRGSTGEIETEQFLAENGQVEAGDVKLDIAFEYSVTLRAEREPGLPLAALGGMLILLGLIGHLLWPLRRLWIIVYPEPRGCSVQLIAPRHEANAPWLKVLMAYLSGETNG